MTRIDLMFFSHNYIKKEVSLWYILLGVVPRWKLWKQTIYIKFGFTDVSYLKLLAKQGFTIKSSNFHKIPLVNHWIFRKISYLCPRIKAFFAYCKIQKRAEVRSFPYCYLYNIGKRPTSWFSIKVQFRASYPHYLFLLIIKEISKAFLLFSQFSIMTVW